jgi:uncharacterized protein YjbI with pentapeptide repeats
MFDVAKRAAKPVAVDPQAVARTKFLEQGTDPVIAKKALEDATAVSRALWLSFLTFGTYLVITFAGVTHRDLLLETPIKLPVLNAPLPLVTFFWVAPILFVIFHLYLLLSLKLLADQVHSYVAHMEEVGLDTDAQDRARLQLPNFVVVQVLGGTSGQVNSWAGSLMRFTAFLTVVAGPLILLLFAQLMFLPYHGWGVTMAQRVMVVTDIVFILHFWRAIMFPQRQGFEAGGGMVFAPLVILSFFGFMFPGERFYGPLAKFIFSETGIVVEREKDGWTYVKANEAGLAGLYNTLMLSGERFVDDNLFRKLNERNRDKGLKPWEGEKSFGDFLRNRDFRQADFSNTDLRKANLSGSIFVSADFAGASLDGATFDDASMQGASFVEASLKGASLMRASLQGATFAGASLQGGYLVKANLQGASLVDTSLQGTSLISASLHAASLDRAQLDGANLLYASLQGATLNGTEFDGATLKGAKVWRTRHSSFVGMYATDITDLDYGSALSSKKYEMLKKQSLSDLPQSVSLKVEQLLLVLSPDAPDPNDTIVWKNEIESNLGLAMAKTQRISMLVSIACQIEDSPYIAEGIIDYRLSSMQGDLRDEALPLVEKLLNGCPGTIGIDQQTTKNLQQLKDKLTRNVFRLDEKLHNLARPK